MEKINTNLLQTVQKMDKEENASQDMLWGLYYSDIITRKENDKKT